MRSSLPIHNQTVTTDDAWEEWILYILDAIEQTSLDTVNKLNRIRALLDEMVDKVKAELPKIYSRELVELLFHQPYCKVAFFVKHKLAERKAVARYLNALEEKGVLRSKPVGKEKLFINVRLYDLLAKHPKV
jgi:Fic family protein